MPVAAADMGVLGVAGRDRTADLQALQDPALIQVRPFAAALAQVEQLFLQRQQAVDAQFDVVDVFVDQGVDVLALSLRAVAQAQQAADLLEGHVEAAAIADKRQAFGVGLGVKTVVAFAASRFRQQPFTFVIADGFDLTVGQFRQFTNFHGGRLVLGA